MGWTAAATVAVGYLSAQAAAEDAAKNRAMQERAMKRQTSISQQQLDFQMQQYDDWKELFGETEAAYARELENMTGETLAASGLEKHRESYKVAQESLQRRIAQRNIDSPAAEMLQQSLDISKAEGEAGIRHQAELDVLSMKGQAVRGGNPAAAGVTNVYGQQASMYGQQSTAYGKLASADSAREQAGWKAVGSGVGTYAGYQMSQNRTSIPETTQTQTPTDPGTYYRER